MMKRFVFAFLAVLLSAGLLGAQEKYALVIGNAAYQQTRPLVNTVNDAVDIATALRSLGYQVDLR